MTLTVGVIADLHIEASNVEGRLAELEATCDDLLSGAVHPPLGEPDLVLLLGDLIREVDPETDRDVLGAVGEFLTDLPVPVEVTFGNHDVMTLETDEALSALGFERSWFFDDERELVVLDSASPRLGDARGELTDEQATKLRTDLAPMEAGLVFVHHPLRNRDVSENPWFDQFPEEAFCGNRRAYIDRGYEGAAVVVSGHLHETHLTTEDGIIYLGVDAFNKVMGHGQNGACAVLSRSPSGVTVAHRGGNGEKHVIER